MKQNKLAHDDVRQKLKSVEDRTSPEYQALNINLHTFQAERTAVQEKMEELKNALKRLEEEDTMINRKIIETQKEISSLDETCNGEVAMLKKELAQASKTAESDNSIRALANQLAVYESSVKNSVNVSSAVSTGNENIAEIIPNKIGLYLTRARNYFRSEADCVQFLRNRVRTLEKEIISLVSRKMLNASLLLVTQYLPVSISLLLTEEPTRGVYIPGIDYQRTPSFTFN
jgi:chromosome segregation ATPase